VRPLRRRRWAAWATAAALAMTVTACSGGSGGADGRSDQRCGLSAKAVPSCGVLWGISTQPPKVDKLHELEKDLGRPFDFVYRYHDVNDVVPDDDERQIVAGGRLLHIAIAARDFSAASRAGVSWADIADGTFDDTLSAQARGIASLKVPVFVTFEQEANQKAKLGVAGNASEFKAAWRHLHELYVSAGATNAVWTWVMTGFTGNLARAATLWPGNDVVDWISWNVYNQSGCHGGNVDQKEFKSFDEDARPFYLYFKQHAASIGMDFTKPMMISETGSVKYDDSPALTADWYAAIPATLRDFPQIKAVGLWDSVTDTCNYEFDTDPDVVDGVRKAGLDPSVDIGGALSR
jgi:hypothetical protein